MINNVNAGGGDASNLIRALYFNKELLKEVEKMEYECKQSKY